MRTKINLGPVFALIAACLLAGCASYPISKPLRQAARKDITFEQALKDPTPYKGALVIWGGYIIDVVNSSTGTEVSVLETPLCGEEPRQPETSQGRFIAYIDKFLDPAVFRKGRKVTVAGNITGREVRPLGKIDYAYPVLEIEELHMWERERPYPYDPMFDFGFWYGPGGFYDGYEYRHW